MHTYTGTHTGVRAHTHTELQPSLWGKTSADSPLLSLSAFSFCCFSFSFFFPDSQVTWRQLAPRRINKELWAGGSALGSMMWLLMAPILGKNKNTISWLPSLWGGKELLPYDTTSLFSLNLHKEVRIEKKKKLELSKAFRKWVYIKENNYLRKELLEVSKVSHVLKSTKLTN